MSDKTLSISTLYDVLDIPYTTSVFDKSWVLSVWETVQPYVAVIKSEEPSVALIIFPDCMAVMRAVLS